LERLGLARWLGTTLVLLSFLVLIVLLVLLLVPLVRAQATHLAEVLPSYATSVRQRLMPTIDQLVRRLSPQDVARLRDAAGNYAGDALSWVGAVL
ncbi:AI-2E family transporter, partial [Sabulibacter ruber]